MRFLARRILLQAASFCCWEFLCSHFTFLQLAPGNFFDDMRLNPQIFERQLRPPAETIWTSPTVCEQSVSWVEWGAKSDWGISLRIRSGCPTHLVACPKHSAPLGIRHVAFLG